MSDVPITVQPLTALALRQMREGGELEERVEQLQQEIERVRAAGDADEFINGLEWALEIMKGKR